MLRNLFHWITWVGLISTGASLVLTVPASAYVTSGRTLTMEATAYGPSAQDNYPYGATDYFGQPLTAGDIAVDPSVIPLRTCVYVTGYHSRSLPASGFVGEADDEGGAIQGMHVDLFMNTSPSQVSNFGIQTVKVRILGPADSTSASGTRACASYLSTVHSSPPGSGRASTVGSGQTVGTGNNLSKQARGNARAATGEETAEGRRDGLMERSFRSHPEGLDVSRRGTDAKMKSALGDRRSWWWHEKRQTSHEPSPVAAGRAFAPGRPSRTKV